MLNNTHPFVFLALMAVFTAVSVKIYEVASRKNSILDFVPFFAYKYLYFLPKLQKLVLCGRCLVVWIAFFGSFWLKLDTLSTWAYICLSFLFLHLISSDLEAESIEANFYPKKMYNLRNGAGRINIATPQNWAEIYPYVLLQFATGCDLYYAIVEAETCKNGINLDIAAIDYLPANTYTVRAYAQESPTNTITSNAKFLKQFNVKISHEQA